MISLRLKKYSENTTNIKIVEGVPVITYKALDQLDFIYNGYSTRLGGVSEGYLSSMNLGWERNDLKENVVKNHEIMAKAIGFDSKNIVTSHQTHTTNVRKVSSADRGKGVYTEREFNDIDGLITNDKDVILATYYADCVPLYIVDPVNKAIGLSHSGWKGTVNKMGKATLNAMKEEFGTNPEDVIVCIGPSICMDCYEVSSDVAEEFKKAFKNSHEMLLDKGSGKYQLDLWTANVSVFKECGVFERNIHKPDICTCCNYDVLFSHRATNGKRGNNAAFLGIKY